MKAFLAKIVDIRDASYEKKLEKLYADIGGNPYGNRREFYMFDIRLVIGERHSFWVPEDVLELD